MGADGVIERPARFETRLPRAKPADDGDLSWAPAWRIREMVGARRLSPVEVIDHFLARIEQLNPQLHPFRQVDADGARAQARRAEAAVMAGEALGPLHGVPLGLKEFLPIKDMSWRDLASRTHRTAPWDAIETERVRAAGAVVVGPTVAGAVAQEFGESDLMPLNPWDTARVCGDSSSGSACAAASAMTPLNIAADGLGSTRLPAAFCGLVGLHATRGLVPSFEWERLFTRPITTSGPLARDVRDAATVLSVLAGPDGRELMGLPDQPDDYLGRLEDGARGMRLVWTDDFGYARRFAVAETERVIETVRTAALRLQAAGAVVEATDAAFENPGRAAQAFLMADPTLFPDAKIEPEKATQAREARGRIAGALRRALDGADFIITPTVLCVAPTRAAWADPDGSPAASGLYTAMTGVANLLGWPAISVPAGLVDGLPVGLQILGRPKSEARMLQLAQAFLAAQE
ncbi:MAG TPA: amidase [Caulobacteraceae bacterium]|nr:amidase [Caulobacteraceae bacterium]